MRYKGNFLRKNRKNTLLKPVFSACFLYGISLFLGGSLCFAKGVDLRAKRLLKYQKQQEIYYPGKIKSPSKHLIGKISAENRIIDLQSHLILGYVNGKSQVFNPQGQLIGRASNNTRLAAFAIALEDFDTENHVGAFAGPILDSKGKWLGEISNSGMMTLSSSPLIVGRVVLDGKHSGKVFDSEGKKLGKVPLGDKIGAYQRVAHSL